MKKVIMVIAELVVMAAVSLVFFMRHWQGGDVEGRANKVELVRERQIDDRRDDGAYRTRLAENVEAQRNAAREATRLRRELDGIDFVALAARREAAVEEEKTAIDAMLAKRARAERLERVVARLQNEARRTVAARRQRETAEREGL